MNSETMALLADFTSALEAMDKRLEAIESMLEAIDSKLSTSIIFGADAKEPTKKERA